jgi:DNA anti-recombination protein RmuC
MRPCSDGWLWLAEMMLTLALTRRAFFSQQALELAEREVILKEQMNTYGDKFKELQETLTKSNEVFTSFKKDSEKMQKRIKASEKERLVAEKLALKSTKELNEVNEKHEVSLPPASLHVCVSPVLAATCP